MKIRCPHCRNPIDVVEDENFSDITCYSCGSQINLLSNDEDTVTFASGPKKQIAHFELTDQLGVGAFGSVYKALDTNLDREVAIKIPRQNELSPDDTEKFLREARAAAQLKHSNIVGVHEVGRTDDSVYIVSDYIQGADLKQWAESRPLTCQDAAKLCHEVALALHHAHENGVVHRDLKPSNIMIDMDGNPFLTDFGLAKRETGEITLTIQGQILGTPAYMSPEQAKGDTHLVDRRSDIYSLGVVLFQLITGVLPFRGEKRMLMVQIIQDDPPSPRKLSQSISRDLETICLKAMMKEPRQRYQTAKDFAEDLRRYLNNEPVLARPVGSIQKSIKWFRNRPLVATLTGCLIISLVLGFSGVIWQWREAVAATDRESLAKSRALESAEAEMKSARLANDAVKREIANNKRLARQLYAVNTIVAGNRYQSGLVFEAKQLLKNNKTLGDEKLLGFENALLTQLCGDPDFEITSSMGTNPGSKGIAISPDGEVVATLDKSGKVKFWNGKDGSPDETLNALEKQINESVVSAIKFSGIGNQLAVICERSLQIWDYQKQELQFEESSLDMPINDLQFHPDGNSIVMGTGVVGESKGKLFLLELSGDGAVRQVGDFGSAVGCVQFSQNGELLAACEIKPVVRSNDTKAQLRIWKTANLDLKSELQIDNCQKSSFVFHPKLPSIIALGFNPKVGKPGMEIAVWDFNLKRPTQRIELGLNIPGRIVVTQDGMNVLTSDSQRIRIWKIENGLRLAHAIRAYDSQLGDFDYSSKTGKIISATKLESDSVKGWDKQKLVNPLELTGHGGWVRCVAYSPKGDFVVTGSQRSTLKGKGQVIVYDSKTYETIGQQAIPDVDIESLCISSSGDSIAAGCSDGSIKLFDAKNLKMTGALQNRKYAVTSVTFSSDDSFLCSSDGRYRKLSPDGTYFDNYSTKGQLCVWNLKDRSKKLTVDEFEGAITSQVVADDQIALGTDKGFVSVWNMASGTKQIHKKVFSKSVTAIAFCPIRKSFAFAGIGGVNGNEVLVKIFDKNWAETDADRGNRNAINAIAFSPNGKTLVTAGFDGRLCFFDPIAGHLRLVFPSKQILDIAFSPDGKSLIVGATNKKAFAYWTK